MRVFVLLLLLVSFPLVTLSGWKYRWRRYKRYRKAYRRYNRYRSKYGYGYGRWLQDQPQPAHAAADGGREDPEGPPNGTAPLFA
ncbi:unnamed protein product [Vitrella brassicaformis CCMP3155]|uniref:Uncharacterized protein n=1 Tax=Vitrella brassicaformis (strain CCMP3155) TaxID=1169540 RepID=A0A0G4FJD7_VITBC|nr:unnamed protein product [Vitrella brassicaformis CCMP3155]|eukprot:CEM13213.1 unnamed protein product [Vitrella brassicaformis CCMP3155]